MSVDQGTSQKPVGVTRGSRRKTQRSAKLIIMEFSGQTRKRKVDQSTRVTMNRDELLRAHTQELLQQEQLKQQDKAVRLFQRWFRGRRCAGRVKEQYRTLVTKRLSDLQKLEKALKDNYVLVLDKAVPELVKFFVFSYAPSQTQQLTSLCRMLLIMFKSLQRRVSPFFQDATIPSSRSRLVYLLGSLCEFTATSRSLDPDPYEFCTLILDPQHWLQSLRSLDAPTVTHMCDRILQLASSSRSFFSYLTRSMKETKEVRPRDFKAGENLQPVQSTQPWYQYAWGVWGQKCSERGHLEFLWTAVMPLKHGLAKLPPELIRLMVSPANIPALLSFVEEKVSSLLSLSDRELTNVLAKSPDFLYNLCLLLYFFGMSARKIDIAPYVKMLIKCFAVLKKHFRVKTKYEDPFQLRGFRIGGEEEGQQVDMELEPQSLGIFDLEEEREESKETEEMDVSPSGGGLPSVLLESYELLETSHVIKLLTSCCDLLPLCNLYCDLYLTMVHAGRKTVDELLCKLVYNTTLVRQMYSVFLSVVSAMQMFDVELVVPQLRSYISLLTLFTGCLSQLLLVIDDNEFHSEEPQENRLSISESSDITVFLNQMGYKLCLANLTTAYYQQYGAVLFRNVENVLNQLYDRHCRRPFVRQSDWNLCQIEPEALVRSLGSHSKYSLMLERMPHLFPFETRATIFHYLVLGLKHESYREMDHFISVQIRRSHIVEDAIEELRHLSGKDMITAARITFIGPGMVPEMGVDAGGLFKEFLTNFAKVAFDPSSGYFIEADKRALIPNPRYMLEHPTHGYVYEVMGMIIGKAIIEEVLLQPNFSRIFLNKLLGKPCYFSDLKELDLQYAKSLEMVKHYPGDYEDLGLWFSTSEEVNGGSVSIPLIPGGERTPVTRNNVMRYIKAMTNYKLNLQILEQCEAFLQGLNKVLPLQYLGMFNQDELQLMISGNMQGFDVNDLRANVQFAGYTESNKAIQNLWKYLSELDDEGRSKFLQFCTGCSRAPLLGFKYLTPKFTIEMGADTNMLPTASTCTNTFRLPPFKNYKTMKEKLDLAITSNAGFGFG